MGFTVSKVGGIKVEKYLFSRFLCVTTGHMKFITTSSHPKPESTCPEAYYQIFATRHHRLLWVAPHVSHSQKKNSSRTGTILLLWHFLRIAPSTKHPLDACMSEWLHFHFPCRHCSLPLFSTTVVGSRKNNSLLRLWRALFDSGLWTTTGEVIH